MNIERKKSSELTNGETKSKRKRNIKANGHYWEEGLNHSNLRAVFERARLFSRLNHSENRWFKWNYRVKEWRNWKF